MFPSGPPSAKEIEKIARRTTDIIKLHLTEDVCVFGSAAAYLWADIDRVPGDVDILVNHPFYDAEHIKQVIVDADDRYFLEPSKKRGATYKILNCCLPGWHAYGRYVKVDILTPDSDPDLNLPEIPAYDTPEIEEIPVMPLFDLLVLKTQGWWDHCVSERRDYQAKVDADVGDVFALLDRAQEEGVDYRDELAVARHTDEFMELALVLARGFAKRNGLWKKWRAIGFRL
ncbi:hypothetical protein V8E53_009091 [Lactarius tabidus]